MEVYRTEEEQLEALKRWWQENGKSLLIGIVLALAAVYGYKAWQNYQQTQGETASNLYFDMMDALTLNEENPQEATSATLEHLIGQLKTEHEGSTYAIYAALVAAKQAVAAGDLPKAQAELQWALDKSDKGSSLQLITQLRLARVIFAQGGDENGQRALALLDGAQAGSHAASYAEFKGDVLVSLGRLDEARTAYRLALTENEAVGVARPLVQIKLDDLAADGENQ